MQDQMPGCLVRPGSLRRLDMKLLLEILEGRQVAPWNLAFREDKIINLDYCYTFISILHAVIYMLRAYY